MDDLSGWLAREVTRSCVLGGVAGVESQQI